MWVLLNKYLAGISIPELRRELLREGEYEF